MLFVRHVVDYICIMRKINSILFLFCILVSASARENYAFRNIANENGLSNSAVRDICQDDKGYIWIATLKGLNRYNGFTIQQYHSADASGLISDCVETLTSLGEDVMIGTDKGLCRYIMDREVIENVMCDGTSIGEVYDIQKTSVQGMLYVSSASGLYIYADDCLKRISEASDIIKLSSDQAGNLWAVAENRLMNITINGLVIASYDIETLLPYQNENPCLLSCVYVDGYDNVWVGTQSQGLFHFDLKTKKLVPIRLSYISNNEMKYVRCMMADNQGNLWIGTENGLFIFDLTTRECSHYKRKNNVAFQSISDNAIYSIFKSRENLIWIGTFFGGVDVTDTHTGRMKYFLPDDGCLSLNGHATSAIMEDSSRRLWFASEDNGISILNRDTETFAYLNTSSVPSLAGNNVHALAEDPDGNVWVGNFMDGLHVVSHDLKSVRRVSVPVNSIYKLLMYKSDSMYIGTASGLYVYSFEDDALFEFKPEVFAHARVDDMLFDLEGNLWVCTHFDGIFRYSYADDSLVAFDVADFAYCCHLSSDGKVWCGTCDAGLVCFEGNEYKTYNLEDDGHIRFIYSIQEDLSGCLWISTDEGIYSFDTSNDALLKYDSSHHPISNQFNLGAGLCDSVGDMYFGSIGGVCSFSPSVLGDKKVHPSSPKLIFSDLKVFNTLIFPGSRILELSLDDTDNVVLNHDENTISFDISPLILKSDMLPMFFVEYKMAGVDREFMRKPAEPVTVTYTNLEDGEYEFTARVVDSYGTVLDLKELLFVVKKHPLLSNVMLCVYAVFIFILLYCIFHSYRKRTNYEAKISLNEQRIKLFTYISHEFKTPLSVILAILDKGGNEGKVTLSLSEWGMMSRNAKRLQFLIRQLLDFRSVESGQCEVNYVKDNIVLFLENCFSSFEPIFLQKSVRSSFSSDVQHDEVYFDPDKIEKIYANLLSNAAKHVKCNGAVQTKIETVNDEMFRITVFNSDSYIPEEHFGKIVQPFFKSESRHEHNNGIGLALVKEMLHLLGGSLSIKSDRDIGTTFIAMFPVVLSEQMDVSLRRDHDNSDFSDILENTFYELSEADVEIKSNATETSVLYTVLLVEDNKDFNELLSDGLKGKYNVKRAYDGITAKGMLGADIDIILSDINLPGMTGDELCRFVKSNRYFMHIPVILFTSESTKEVLLRSLDYGADAYIEKPFTQQELLAKMKNLLLMKDRICIHYHDTISLGLMNNLANKDEAFISDMTRFVQENLGNAELNVDDLARHAKISRTLLYKRLKDTVNLSASEFIAKIRVEYAMDKLSNTNQTVSEIAWMTGFSSPSYFIKTFKRHCGMTPKEFRMSGSAK